MLSKLHDSVYNSRGRGLLLSGLLESMISSLGLPAEVVYLGLAGLMDGIWEAHADRAGGHRLRVPPRNHIQQISRWFSVVYKVHTRNHANNAIPACFSRFLAQYCRSW